MSLAQSGPCRAWRWQRCLGPLAPESPGCACPRTESASPAPGHGIRCPRADCSAPGAAAGGQQRRHSPVRSFTLDGPERGGQSARAGHGTVPGPGQQRGWLSLPAAQTAQARLVRQSQVCSFPGHRQSPSVHGAFISC